MKFNVALLQLSPQGTDQSKNLEKGIEYCKKAKELGADLVLFPEEWNIGFQMCPADETGRKSWENAAIDQKSDFFQGFVETAKNLELNIAITYLEKFDPKPKNSISIINNKGEVVLNYSKVFICNFGMEELEKENPDYDEIGCDYNCTAGDSLYRFLHDFVPCIPQD
jgi:predicted amidohydrolase